MQEGHAVTNNCKARPTPTKPKDFQSRSVFECALATEVSSSGFVETVKTASFSKASISIGPRSHRLTRSTETRGNRSSNVRYSIDSDRPITRPSLDEGALRR